GGASAGIVVGERGGAEGPEQRDGVPGLHPAREGAAEPARREVPEEVAVVEVVVGGVEDDGSLGERGRRAEPDDAPEPPPEVAEDQPGSEAVGEAGGEGAVGHGAAGAGGKLRPRRAGPCALGGAGRTAGGRGMRRSPPAERPRATRG